MVCQVNDPFSIYTRQAVNQTVDALVVVGQIPARGEARVVHQVHQLREAVLPYR